MADHKKIDHVTGIETTGHVWDEDLQELNKPLPKWWLYVMYASIVWSIGYWIVYPAWPLASDYTRGMWDYSQRRLVTEQVAAGKAAQGAQRGAIAVTKLEDIVKDRKLLEFAIAGGKAAFGDNCAGCHGRGAQGAAGYPNLNDDEWLWGGKLPDIHTTLLYGIRSGDKKARDNAMPRYGEDKLLDEKQIDEVTEFVLSLSGKSTGKGEVERGAKTYSEQCVSCHGDKGQGNQELGAPSLVDQIWLYGGSKADVVKSIQTGRGGVMPAWHTRLDQVTIKQLAIYVHTLGGGK